MGRWYRKTEGMVYDPKWRLIARRAGTSPSFVRDVFEHMLDYASTSDNAMLSRWDDEVVATNMDVDTDIVVRIREAMQGVVLEGNAIRAWEKRQDYSSPRVRAFRERQAAARIDASPADLPVAIPPVLPLQPAPLAVPVVLPPPAKAKAKPRRRIEDNEQPSDKQKQAARDFGLSQMEFREEWCHFRDFHCAKGSVMADWNAAWRTWLTNRKKGLYAPRAAPQGHEDMFVKVVKQKLGEIEDESANPDAIDAIASTLPDAAFRTASDPELARQITDDGPSSLLDLAPIRAGYRDFESAA